MFWSLENLRTSEVFGVAKTAANIIIIIFLFQENLQWWFPSWDNISHHDDTIKFVGHNIWLRSNT